MAFKTVEVARANLESSISLIPDRYKRGVQGANWADPASSDQAETNYAAGVQRAVSSKTRQSRIREVGNSVWQNMSMTKGAAAIGEGIRLSLNKYATNFGRVYNAALPAMQGIPARTINPMENIDRRLKPVVQAWIDNKLR